jgi:hypothetical protein
VARNVVASANHRCAALWEAEDRKQVEGLQSIRAEQQSSSPPAAQPVALRARGRRRSEGIVRPGCGARRPSCAEAARSAFQELPRISHCCQLPVIMLPLKASDGLRVTRLFPGAAIWSRSKWAAPEFVERRCRPGGVRCHDCSSSTGKEVAPPAPRCTGRN